MEFNSFVTSVNQLWDQAWLSVVYLFLIWLSLRWCFPTSYVNATAFYQRHLGNIYGTNALRGFLHSIGASAVYPVVIAILVIMLFKVITALVFTAEFLPPNIIPDSCRIAYPVFSPIDLNRLSQLFPDAADFREAYDRAQTLFSEGVKDSFFTKILILAKFLIVSLFVMFVFCARRERWRWICVRRTITFGAYAVLFWAICIPPLLAEAEEYEKTTAKQLTVKVRNRLIQEQWPAPVQATAVVPKKFQMPYNSARWWKLGFSAVKRLEEAWLVCFPKDYTPTYQETLDKTSKVPVPVSSYYDS